MADETVSFKDEFVWGVGSSAYQIEGAVEKIGRTPGIWDRFSKEPGRIADGDTAQVAINDFQLFSKDMEYLKNLGVGAYRMSISWPRLIPGGQGLVNSEALDFYDKKIDLLLSQGIEPWLTLFHWDLPVEIFDQGGWLNRDTSKWFGDFVNQVSLRYSDRIKNWITLNEPQVFLGLGMVTGEHAPGVQFSRKHVLQSGHNVLLAHGEAVTCLRETAGKPSIGFSPGCWPTYPLENTEDCIKLAYREMFTIPDNSIWFLNNSWFSDAVVFGKYPMQGLDMFGSDYPEIQDGDMEKISQSIDFLGANIYHGSPVTTKLESKNEHTNSMYPRAPGHPRTSMDWTVDPQALYWGPKFLYERYKKPIFITENGMASNDWVHRNGRVVDSARIDFLARYLSELKLAVNDGIDIRGYFHWTLIDNFEWEKGYTKRFGLIYNNHRNQERIPKDSYYWYKDVIQTNGACLPGAQDMVPLR